MGVLDVRRIGPDELESLMMKILGRELRYDALLHAAGLSLW